MARGPAAGEHLLAYGGTYYAIPRRSAPEKKQLAWQLIQALTLDRQRQLDAFRSQDAFPALLAAGRRLTSPCPSSAASVPACCGEAARRIPAVKLHKQQKFADEVVNAELDNVLEYGKSKALEDAQALLIHWPPMMSLRISRWAPYLLVSPS
jgi:multiple sugar transport system substrate-binding protein